MKSMTLGNQRGGTILGIIIGVLVGLGAALAVAIYVTKVPVPFVNKSGGKGSSTDQDAAEAKKNKDWDPNAPLYGKNPAKPNPAASGMVGTVPLDTATGTAATATKPAASAAKAAKPAATASAAGKPGTADPLGDLAKAKTAAAGTAGGAATGAAGSTAAGVDPFTYLVQAGAFRTPEDAESQRAKLGLLGIDAKISEREQSGRTVYRVRVGPFSSQSDAEKTKEKLDGNGFDTALVRVQR